MLNLNKWLQIPCMLILLVFSAFCSANTVLDSPINIENLPVTVTNPSNCGLGLTVNDESCPNNNILEVDIEVTNAPGTALGTDVFLKELRVIFEHDWTADLDFFLVAPNGTRVEISTDNGSAGDNYGIINGSCDSVTAFISTIFDNGCSTPNIRNASAPFVGQFLPEGDFNDFNDGQSPNGIWRLEACDDGQFNQGRLQFVELVFAESNCLAPYDLIEENVTASSIEISWQSNVLNPTDTLFEYGPTGFTLGQGMTSTTLPIQGLQPSTNYDVYVQEACSPGVFTTISCPITVSTICTPAVPTLSEDLNNQNLCTTSSNCALDCDLTGLWANVSNDQMNWLVREGATPSGFTGPSADVEENGRYLYIEATSFFCQEGDSAMLLSNLVTIESDPNTCEMSFNYHMFGQHISTLQLDITTDCGDTWQALFMADGDKGDQWQTTYIDLDSYENMDVQFRFVAKKGSGFRGDIAIDNLKFFGPQLSSNQVNTFYFDGDEDGFGDDGNFITTCNPNGPNGYILQSGDCNDNDEFINPAMEEIPCNFTDDNCNGFGDEAEVEFPEVIPDEICEGEVATLQAFSDNPDAEILWYENENDFFTVAEGEFFSPADIPNLEVSTTTVITYWVTTFVPPFCFNEEKTPVTITIYPNPDLVAQTITDACIGTNLNLLDFVNDEKETNGTWLCFDENNNAIQNCTSTILNNETFKIRKIADGGCQDSIFIDIAVLTNPIAQISGNSTICIGDNQFLSGSEISNAPQPLTYQWNTGNTGTLQQVFDNGVPNSSDFYTLTVTAANGCAHTDTFEVTTIQSISNVAITKEDVTVCNGMDGALTIEITGGTPPYFITWNGSMSGQMMTSDTNVVLDNLMQGSYSLNIADSSGTGCDVTTPLTIINGPGAVISNPIVTPESCFGQADGCISIEVSGTNPTIIWSNGLQNDTICNLASDYYSVTVFDGNCTTEVDSIFVPSPVELMVFANTTNVSCAGGNDGQITLNAFGGTSPYIYSWEDDSMLAVQENLTAGFYSVTVIDANGCEFALSNIEITEPAALIFTEEVSHPTCFNSSNGSISIMTSGGIAPYQIEWSNNAQGFNNTFLLDGTYHFTITDGSGCSLTDSTQVIEPEEVTVDIFRNNTTCNGINDGSINLVVNGGTPPFMIEWNNGDEGPQIEDLSSGYYFALLTDANSCNFVTDSIYIDAPELLDFQVQITPSHCDGVDDGALKIVIEDGQDYDFSWALDPVVTDSCLSNLQAGDYLLTITGPDMCQIDTLITVPTTERIFVNSQVLSSACVGSTSGAISLNITGENPLFFVEWSNDETMVANEQASIDELAPGAYATTITDDLGCVKTIDSLMIDENPEIEILDDYMEHNICFGGEIGVISVSINGGSGIYETNWSNGATETSTNENLAAGSYMLTVTDDNGCVKVSKVFDITQPDAFQITSNLVDANECITNLVDSLCVTVSGATPPYTYEWSNGETSTCLIGQPVGEYSITATDANGCEGIKEDMKIPDPVETLSFTYPMGDSLLLDCPDSEGNYLLLLEGGTQPFQFIWSHGEKDTIAIDSLLVQGLDAGACNVTVTDDRGCVAVSDSIHVFRPDSIDILVTEIEEVGCKGGRNGEIHIDVTGGTLDYSFEWYNEFNVLWGTEQNLLDTVEAGFYTIELRDANDCFATFQDIEVIEPDSILNVFPLLSRDTICHGASNGFIDITPSGGYAPYSFHWGNEAMTQDIFNLPAGSYGLTMTDAGDCEFILPPYFIIESAAPITFVNSEITDVDCFGNQNGAIDVTFTGGWQPLEYQWVPSDGFPNPNIEDPSDLNGGNYILFVTDAVDCFFEDLIFEVNEPDELVIEHEFSSPNHAAMQADIAIIPSGGTFPYVYSWEDGNMDSFRESMDYGTYFVTVTDAHDCETITEITLDATTNTDNIEEINELKIYPNPTDGLAYLEIDLSKPVNFSLEVFDLLGKKVHSHHNSVQTTETIPLDFTHLPNGTYFIQLLVNQNVIHSKKLILID